MNEPQLTEAAKAGDIHWKEALVKTGEDLEQKDNYGWTALNWAADCSRYRTAIQQTAYAKRVGQIC